MQCTARKIEVHRSSGNGDDRATVRDDLVCSEQKVEGCCQGNSKGKGKWRQFYFGSVTVFLAFPKSIILLDYYYEIRQIEVVFGHQLGKIAGIGIVVEC